MYSYRHFTPGGRTDTTRIINYVASYNDVYPNSEQLNCYCTPDKYDKNTPSPDSQSMRVSYATRIGQVIRSTKGGKTQYGNFYLGEPLNVNYLGRIQGMPGGSGSPPVNKF
jgi:hypothetical protein